MKKQLSILLVGILILGAADLQAACDVKNSDGQSTNRKSDPLFAVLQSAEVCPVNVQAFKDLVRQSGLTTEPSMVANRGIHNPKLGSFSFFEEVLGVSAAMNRPIQSGEFFFGHFTTTKGGVVLADQRPLPGKLLIELIVWDHAKSLFNFYELIGTGNGAQWFYRGDSLDILKDNAFLYLNSDSPSFGKTFRCSACHTSGGPIMKEISAPFNDWWTFSRPLIFEPNKLSSEVASWVEGLGDASNLATSVKTGIALLETSSRYQEAKRAMSLQARLRPLFCETEINLESDFIFLDSESASIEIPSASLVSPFLAHGKTTLSKSAYKQLLDDFFHPNDAGSFGSFPRMGSPVLQKY